MPFDSPQGDKQEVLDKHKKQKKLFRNEQLFYFELNNSLYSVIGAPAKISAFANSSNLAKFALNF